MDTMKKLATTPSSLLVFMLMLGIGYVSFNAQAATTQNAQQLTQKVRATDKGWDWIPRCADGASWSTSKNRCQRGTGSDSINSRHYSSSRYRLTNQQSLLSKVHQVDKGWDWRPRCANGAHWSWGSNRCKGGVQ